MLAAVALAVAVAAPAAADSRSFGSASRSIDGALSARLSAADTATEYWDVTAWFESGERFLARFMITNQGPGDRTAAAFGYVLLADGRALPFKWGRLRDQWKIDPKGRSMKIGKARLDLSGSSMLVSVDSKKHGVVARLEIERALPLGRSEDLEIHYEIEYAAPGPARGTIETDAGSRAVVGSAAVVHTSLPRLEAELIRRRDEVVARTATHALYLSSIVRLDGTRRTLLATHHPDRDDHGGTFATLELDGPDLDGDPRYPVASLWTVQQDANRYDVALRKELLRMNPLEILPLPFRLLLSLGNAPQRVWANATVELEGIGSKDPITLDGIAISTFANPER
jgi:hypothetical protein